MNANYQEVMLQLDLAQRSLAAGDGSGHLKALDRALELEPYCLPALLMKGRYLETTHRPRLAALVYVEALKIAPDESELSPSLRKLLIRAKELAAADAEEFHAHLTSAIDGVRTRHAHARLDRFDYCLDVFSRRKKLYQSECSLLHFPQLPALAFFDNADFPWLSDLSAATADIVAEATAARETMRSGFRPYIDAAPGTPLNQWADLNKSQEWSTLFFWNEGRRDPVVCDAFPKTARACEAAPMVMIPEHAPTAMYSVLAPGARIPPHTGMTNTRLVVHLPLVVPAGCVYRVGHDVREWKVGVPWVFDDTIEHEAQNKSSDERIVLIFDIWNPLLTDAEKDLVCALLSASREYKLGAKRPIRV